MEVLSNLLLNDRGASYPAATFCLIRMLNFYAFTRHLLFQAISSYFLSLCLQFTTNWAFILEPVGFDRVVSADDKTID
ncbi:hypothetical protein L1987_81910 [Smallanthus sonchifolius]|uniref:Uncharacterized protein n=1 Tax=Smallanthus sonchifolius TaxID=185202 RepID=A0ACB8YSZ9_9ASTR|nr:hypothetical protein L1987_81910 [Smallanthus sonchifolius]